MSERNELVDKAVHLVREADLTPDEWRKMVLDVLTDEYLADVMEESVTNWDEETLRNFVEGWEGRLTSFPYEATPDDFENMVREGDLLEFETFESPEDAEDFAKALRKSISGREAQPYTQVDGESDEVIYLKGMHLVNRTGVYLVAWR